MKRNFFFAVIMLIGVPALPAWSQVPIDEDPVRISPQYYTVLLENDRVRVLEYRLQPGESEPMHSHPPGIVYLLSDFTLVTTFPDGSSTEGSFSAGEVSWRDFTRHGGENVGTTEIHAIAVELKE